MGKIMAVSKARLSEGSYGSDGQVEAGGVLDRF